MINNKKIVVVLPAYNAEKTLQKTFEEIPFEIIDDTIITDDFSNDNTIEIAKKLGIKHIIAHNKNKGYGANQKSCYKKAFELKADIIVMLHPDYQYSPKLIPSMCDLVANNSFDVVLGSRILGKGALQGGMPLYKYISNRVLTFIQNILMNQKLSEYHTGYRCFDAKILEKIDFENNSDDFVFDNEFLAQCCYLKARIGEISCPANYFEEASSINFKRSITYGFGVLRVSFSYFIHKNKLWSFSLFKNL
ncbi:glycosyltransferase family 2 protein [Flavobacterium capsici]|uniref:Glycosyltransferase family 2 protein n=1 Tax=Flavobacterium capsici TaxID=3075618 RepID=A0AA96J6Y7_9FLAO|nr:MULTISPECIES: glycosyltransferase family 2 protein [unclassified Flavobacterium]WNM19372.1 glycosyltransferase family 2 protein [Flavobacterium sp. PMR2A8]WNM20761.1 glycosyltransferase family 2 protein [Flavobacterium sp. PMTSA4]